MRPTRPYRALQHVVATGVIAVVLGLWAHSQVTGRQMDVLWTVAILALLLASGYVLFGRAMGRAVEDAQEIAGEGDGGDGDQEADGDGGTRVAETSDEDPREGNG